MENRKTGVLYIGEFPLFPVEGGGIMNRCYLGGGYVKNKEEGGKDTVQKNT